MDGSKLNGLIVIDKPAKITSAKVVALVKKALLETVQITAMVLLIMTGALAFSQIMSFTGASQGLVEAAINLPIAPILVVILMLIAASASEVFFTERNIRNLFRQIVTNGLLSLGMLVVVLTGGIDLSVGPIVALTGILAAGLTDQIGLALAVLVALAVGVLVGAVNGFLVARFKLAPFIVTLATLSAVRGVVYVYSETPQTPSNPAFRALLGGGFIGPVPVAAIIMVPVFPWSGCFLTGRPPGGPLSLSGVMRKQSGWQVSMWAVISCWHTSYPACSPVWPDDWHPPSWR